MELTEISDTAAVNKLQDANIKVFSLLNVPVSEIQKLDVKEAAKEPKSNLFKLTAAEEGNYVSSKKQVVRSSIDSNKSNKRESRFETPGQLAKVEER